MVILAQHFLSFKFFHQTVTFSFLLLLTDTNKDKSDNLKSINNNLKISKMKTKETRRLSVINNELISGQIEDIDMDSLSRREKTAMKVIYRHPGKRFVYESYSKTSPDMAEKYLKFISKNPWIIYFKWDDKKEKFVA